MQQGAPEDDNYRFDLIGPKQFYHDWLNPVHRRAILACLVSGVYALQRDKENNINGRLSALGHPWWTNFNYQLLDPITSRNGARINGAVFGWRPDLQKPPSAPQFVIAFRGTMSNTSDVMVDLKIYSQNIDSTERFEAAYAAVKNAANWHGIQNICITGHSLGAALGLVSARLMAMEGKIIETHLFNPPFPSSGAPFQSFLAPHSYDRLSVVYSTVKAGLVNAIKSDESKLQSERGFHMLAPWYPNLYVHSRDPVCSGYADYFRNHFYLHNQMGRHHMPHETIRGLLFGSIPYHLIPSAIMHVCDRPYDSAITAHSLNLWWDSDLRIHTQPQSISTSHH